LRETDYTDAKILDYIHNKSKRKVLAESKAVKHTEDAKQQGFTEEQITRGILSGRLPYVNEETWLFKPLELWDGQLRMYIPAWFVPCAEHENGFDRPTCIYTDQRAANLTFVLLPPVGEKDMDETEEIMKLAVKKEKLDATWLSSDRQVQRDTPIRLFEFIAFVQDGIRTYNQVFLLPVGTERNLCIGTFCCRRSTMDAWRPIVKGMINTLQY
jgi:hypothetical protein